MNIEENGRTPILKDRTFWLSILIIATAVFAVYGRCMSFPFSAWDDPIYVRDNTTLDTVTSANLKRIMTPGKDGVKREMIYVPVTYVSWLMECSLFGKNAKVLHTTNVMLHLVNALLVMGFLLLTFRNRAAALFGGLLFAVHPLQVEAVAAIMGRKDLLATLFSLVSIITYATFLSTRKKNWLYGSVLVFALAVFAKPSVILLPAVFVILDYRKHGTWLGGEWGNKLPYVVIMIVALMLHAQMPTETIPRHMPPYSFRLTCVPYVLWHLLSKAAVPIGIMPIYPWPQLEQVTRIALFGGVAVTAIGATLAIAHKKKIPALWQGLLITGILLVPALKVVIDHREFITADRYGYFPFLGVTIALTPLFALKGRMTSVVSCVASLAIAALAVQAFLTTTIWSTPTGVSDRVLVTHPKHVTARLNRAIARAEAGHSGAEDDFLIVMRLAPNLREARFNFRIFLQNKFKENPKDYRSAIRLAILAHTGGDETSAESWFRQAVTVAPNVPRTHTLLVRFLVDIGRDKDAKRELKEALKHHPDDPDLNLLSDKLAQLGIRTGRYLAD